MTSCAKLRVCPGALLWGRFRDCQCDHTCCTAATCTASHIVAAVQGGGGFPEGPIPTHLQFWSGAMRRGGTATPPTLRSLCGGREQVWCACICLTGSPIAGGPVEMVHPHPPSAPKAKQQEAGNTPNCATTFRGEDFGAKLKSESVPLRNPNPPPPV